MKQQILRLIELAREEQKRPKSFAFLPDIIQSLEKMAESLHEKRERREKMAGALGRLVLEDYSFSESKLGGEILELAERFAE